VPDLEPPKQVSSAQLKIVLDNSWTLELLKLMMRFRDRNSAFTIAHQAIRKRNRGSELMFATIYLPNF